MHFLDSLFTCEKRRGGGEGAFLKERRDKLYEGLRGKIVLV
jgi:hypothetical protein